MRVITILFIALTSLFISSMEVTYADTIDGSIEHDRLLSSKIDEINNTNSIKMRKYPLRLFEINKKDKWIIMETEMKIDVEKSVPKMDEPIQIFVDSHNRIRKYISKFSYPECAEHIIEYFDEEGNLSKLIYNSFTLITMNSLYGTVFFHKGKPIDIDTTLLLYNDQNPGKDIVISNKLPLKKYINYHISTTEFMKEHDLIGVDFNKYQSEVYHSFKNPKDILKKRNYYAYINSNNIVLREKPSINSKAIEKMNALTCVALINVIKEDMIDKLGSSYWYKVTNCRHDPQYKSIKHSGYIFGTFIEPIETEE